MGGEVHEWVGQRPTLGAGGASELEERATTKMPGGGGIGVYEYRMDTGVCVCPIDGRAVSGAVRRVGHGVATARPGCDRGVRPAAAGAGVASSRSLLLPERAGTATDVRPGCPHYRQFSTTEWQRASSAAVQLRDARHGLAWRSHPAGLQGRLH